MQQQLFNNLVLLFHALFFHVLTIYKRHSHDEMSENIIKKKKSQPGFCYRMTKRVCLITIQVGLKRFIIRTMSGCDPRVVANSNEWLLTQLVTGFFKSWYTY